MAAGRPREFDCETALDRAVDVFWKQGYEGTSLADLTAAMGINRPSLYAAFGSKEGLFKKALDRYAAGPAGYVARALAEPTARAVVDSLFRGALAMMADPRHPKGCLAVQGALACGAEADSVRKELAERRQSVVVALRKRFERAKKEGDLSAAADPAVLARFFATVLHGLSVQAADGAPRKVLQGVVDLALKSWPT